MKTKVKDNGNQYIDGPIMVRLSSPYESNFFMRSLAAFRRKNHRYLQLQDIGVRSDQPIYANENLTQLNSTIMRAVTKYKKDKKIAAVYSMRRIVFIKMMNDDAPIAVSSLSTLSDSVEQQFFRKPGVSTNAL